MKANELMIGDWCRMKLTFGTQWYTDKVGCINPENELEYEPIKLTEEILNANGCQWKANMNQFEYVRRYDESNYSYYEAFPCDGKFVVEVVRVYKGGSDRIHKVVSHVHELQHALRLCGLNELADNFKLQA